jgi:hypothetical protein
MEYVPALVRFPSPKKTVRNDLLAQSLWETVATQYSQTLNDVCGGAAAYYS